MSCPRCRSKARAILSPEDGAPLLFCDNPECEWVELPPWKAVLNRAEELGTSRETAALERRYNGEFKRCY